MRRLVALLLFCIFVSTAHAGKLKDFEDAADNNSSSNSSSSSSSDNDDTLASTIIDVFFGALFAQNAASSGNPDQGERGNLQGTTIQEVNHNLRQNYSFALPNIRLDSMYFYDPDGVHAFRVKGEAGYLMIAADADYTRFYEGSDRLNDFATHGLLRIPLLTEFFQLDVALGYRRIWGTQVHQGFDFGLPFYINIGRWVQLDTRYYVTFLGDKLPLQEVDAGIAGKFRWIGARAGYRYIKVKGASPIQGPEVGLFVQW
ncbi:MAG: hypothetical protein COV45_03035 [Deltaproteobacteria bacterium CG11_big_fil_rev_8_21_14_0_20_47_16]|nr:MAG: hypothetical protein COV45_03035 [Deltaproteobacteria bacterium CG11_big_fil_rev_8_21_14_0_20_47_16]